MTHASKTVLYVIILFIFLGLFLFARAQQTGSPLILTWSAATSAPQNFAGKVFPSFRSRVSVGADLFMNNELQDLSRANFRWFLDNELWTSGRGEQVFAFEATAAEGGSHWIRTEVEYANQTFEGSLFVQGKDPRLVIQRRSADMVVGVGDAVFRALPYYFNVSSLKDVAIEWRVNGRKAVASPGDRNDELHLSIPQGTEPGTKILVTASAMNRFQGLETATADANVKVE